MSQVFSLCSVTTEFMCCFHACLSLFCEQMKKEEKDAFKTRGAGNRIATFLNYVSLIAWNTITSSKYGSK